MDYRPLSDFDVETLMESVVGLNPKVALFQVSAKTGQGVDEWTSWLESQVPSGTQPWSS
jgi:hydrogenase nickel incorporation protein HypB